MSLSASATNLSAPPLIDQTFNAADKKQNNIKQFLIKVISYDTLPSEISLKGVLKLKQRIPIYLSDSYYGSFDERDSYIEDIKKLITICEKKYGIVDANKIFDIKSNKVNTVKNLKQDVEKELQKKSFDELKNQSGEFISPKKLLTLIKQPDKLIDHEELSTLFSQIGNLISYEKLLTFFKQPDKLISHEELSTLFSQIGNLISHEELSTLFSQIDKSIDHEESSTLFSQIDKSIDHEESSTLSSQIGELISHEKLSTLSIKCISFLKKQLNIYIKNNKASDSNSSEKEKIRLACIEKVVFILEDIHKKLKELSQQK